MHHEVERENTIRCLRAELLAEKSARMVERKALELYAELEDHPADTEFDGNTLVDFGTTAREALSQPAPDMGAVIQRLVSTMERVMSLNPFHEVIVRIQSELKATLADTEAERKRMGL